jgi:signal transduction histidine kinase
MLDIIDELKPMLKKDQQVLHQYEGDAVVKSDQKLLRNIIINLLSNASKFSNEGSSIYIHCRVKPGIASVEVKDQGIGIGEEDQQHLFSSFFRGANALNIQGTGLGLHIVQRYARLLGGHVSLKSKLNEGTTVVIEIPLK